jgi:hypothetical protein
MKKVLAVIIILGATSGIYYLYRQNPPEVVQNAKLPEESKTETPITIKSEEIREKNYTGSKPVISGEGKLADTARLYVADTVAEFAAEANTDVPAMREDWGEDSPSTNYTIDIGATTVASEKTESVIIIEYIYTGGAHGSSSYKTLTASKQTGELLSLSDIVRLEKETEFLAMVKEKLNGWRPEGSDTPVLFTEDVANLSFESFANWSLDNENLNLYFSQYEIGPGVLGAFSVPIPRSKLLGILK